MRWKLRDRGRIVATETVRVAVLNWSMLQIMHAADQNQFHGQRLSAVMYLFFRSTDPSWQTAPRMHSVLYNKAGATLAANRWQAVHLARYYGTYRSRLCSWLCDDLGASMSPAVRRNRDQLGHRRHAAVLTIVAKIESHWNCDTKHRIGVNFSLNPPASLYRLFTSHYSHPAPFFPPFLFPENQLGSRGSAVSPPLGSGTKLQPATILVHLVRHFCRTTLCQRCLGSRNSACLYVCPSVCLLLACFVTKPNNALRIFWYHTKGQSLWFSDTNSGWWATPFPSEICAQTDTSLWKAPTSTDFHL